MLRLTGQRTYAQSDVVLLEYDVGTEAYFQELEAMPRRGVKN